LREMSAIGAIHDALREQNNLSYATALSGVDKFSLDLLERYLETEVLRSNWEVRCAIGNLLTPALSLSNEINNGLIKSSMERSSKPEEWDIAQVIFDALHHICEIPQQARDFVISTAMFHKNQQVRWNVVAALKSVPFTRADLKTILDIAASDNSSWVIKELLKVLLDENAISRDLVSQNSIENLQVKLEESKSISNYLHYLMRLPEHLNSESRYAYIDDHSNRALLRKLLNPIRQLGGPNPPAQKVLGDDFQRLQLIKRQVRGTHGKTYKAAGHVVRERILVSDQQAQQTAILAYLDSGHEALAWASVRELFGRNLLNPSNDFLRLAIKSMLTHPSEWIRREAVEETLRTTNGKLRYISLREIESTSKSLEGNREIKPYLDQIMGKKNGR